MSQDQSQDPSQKHVYDWAEMNGTSPKASSPDEGTKRASSSDGNQGTSPDAGSAYSYHSSPPTQDHGASGATQDHGSPLDITSRDYGLPLDITPQSPDEQTFLSELQEAIRKDSSKVEESLAKLRLNSPSPCQTRGEHADTDTLTPVRCAIDFRNPFGQYNSSWAGQTNGATGHATAPGSSVTTTPSPPSILPLYRLPGWSITAPGTHIQPVPPSTTQQGASTECTGGQQFNPWTSSFPSQRNAPTNAQAARPFRAIYPEAAQPVYTLQSQQQPTEQVFRPMHAALIRQLTPASTHSYQQPTSLGQHLQPNPIEKVMLGFSPHYMGNIHIPRNKSANIPEEENCSLWLTGLPANITYTQILSAITNIGRVYQTHINTPEPEKGHHTSACKVVFFDRPSAQRFWDRFAGRGFVVPGAAEVGRVAWNRVRSAAVDGPKSKELSRVLMICGPNMFVNAGFLTNYFRTKLEFNIDVILEHKVLDEERAMVEYRFASYRCQAESAKMAITRELWEHNVQVWFWDDPCDYKDAGQAAVTGGDIGGVAGGRAAGGQDQMHPAYLDKKWRE